MNPCPREPGYYPAQPDSTCLKDCETRSDNCHGSFIEIAEGLGRRLTKQALSDAPACIATLLDRHLSDPGQGFSVLLERSSISDYIYVWMSGNREIVLNAEGAAAARLHVPPF